MMVGMPRKKTLTPAAWTPNQIVAHNISKARLMRGWTQEQAAEACEPFLGTKLSNASWSALERSVDGNRIRQIDADELGVRQLRRHRQQVAASGTAEFQHAAAGYRRRVQAVQMRHHMETVGMRLRHRPAGVRQGIVTFAQAFADHGHRLTMIWWRNRKRGC